MISVYFFTGFVLLYLIWGFIVYFIDAWIKNKKPSYFFRKKEKYFFEYVYQRLNRHPSNFWVNKKQKLGMDIEGHYNLYPKYKSLDLDEQELLMKSNKDEESKQKFTSEINSSFVEDNDLSQDTPLLDNKSKSRNKYTLQELRNVPVDDIPYNELSFIKKFIKIFTPFELMYRKVWVNDGFIYPQALLTWIIIWFFSISYLGYNSLIAIKNISKVIGNSYDRVYESAYSFIRNAVERYFSLFKYDAAESDLNPYYGQLKTFSDTVDQLVFAIKLGAYVGLTIAVILVFLNRLI